MKADAIKPAPSYPSLDVDAWRFPALPFHIDKLKFFFSCVNGISKSPDTSPVEISPVTNQTPYDLIALRRSEEVLRSMYVIISIKQS